MKNSSTAELGPELVMFKSVESNKRQTKCKKQLGLLHKRSRHLSDVVQKRMVSNCKNISVVNKNALVSFCSICQYGENHKLKHQSSQTKRNALLELRYTDI